MDPITCAQCCLDLESAQMQLMLDICVRAGAALGQALRRAGGPELASNGGAESRSAQEAHRKQMCLQLQVRPSPLFLVQ